MAETMRVVKESDYKPTPYRTLADACKGGVAGIRLMAAAAGQRDFPGVVQEDVAIRQHRVTIPENLRSKPPMPLPQSFARGHIVRLKSGPSATVVKVNVGRTKNGTPVHEVITKDGVRLRVAEKNMKLKSDMF